MIANEPFWHWLFWILPLAGATLLGVRLAATGDPAGRLGLDGLIERLASSVRSRSGMPAWAVTGIWMAVSSLLIAGVGVYWDVSWHIDLGRDQALFTVPHTMILTGLFGIMLSGFASIVLATHERAELAWRFRGLRIPRGGLVLLVLGLCAFIGFPLDDLWHRTYGIDVTLWSPTHETMILGAVLSPLGSWLLYAEAAVEPRGRWRRGVMRRDVAGLLLVALSVQQLEFDTGVPQWQAILQPVLIMFTGGLCLVAARAAFGRGWAVLVAIGFLVTRALVALIVGRVLNLTAPHFPLYLGAAIAVEAAFLVGEQRLWRPLATAVLAGVGVGTLGLATEWGWSQLFGRDPWHASLFAGIWIAALVAPLAAVAGMALGRLGTRRGIGFPGAVAALALAAAIGLVAVPMSRQGAPVTASMRMTDITTETSAGHVVSAQRGNLELDLTPRNAADGADVFRVITWQGGGSTETSLRQDSPGIWRSAGPVVMPARSKTIVFLSHGSIVAAAPVSFPADPEYGLGPIEPRPVRQVQFNPSSALLLREAHAGSPLVAVIAYIAFIGLALGWLVMIAVAFRGLAPPDPSRGPSMGVTGRPQRLPVAAVR